MGCLSWDFQRNTTWDISRAHCMTAADSYCRCVTPARVGATWMLPCGIGHSEQEQATKHAHIIRCLCPRLQLLQCVSNGVTGAIDIYLAPPLYATTTQSLWMYGSYLIGWKTCDNLEQVEWSMSIMPFVKWNILFWYDKTNKLIIDITHRRGDFFTITTLVFFVILSFNINLYWR